MKAKNQAIPGRVLSVNCEESRERARTCSVRLPSYRYFVLAACSGSQALPLLAAPPSSFFGTGDSKEGVLRHTLFREFFRRRLDGQTQ